jgi:hypothetical protein
MIYNVYSKEYNATDEASSKIYSEGHCTTGIGEYVLWKETHAFHTIS